MFFPAQNAEQLRAQGAFEGRKTRRKIPLSRDPRDKCDKRLAASDCWFRHYRITLRKGCKASDLLTKPVIHVLRTVPLDFGKSLQSRATLRLDSELLPITLRFSSAKLPFLSAMAKKCSFSCELSGNGSIPGRQVNKLENGVFQCVGTAPGQKKNMYT